MPIIQNKYDFSVLLEVTNGNPNGDPDCANMPRIDAETGIGFMTDVCIKRKIRDYVATTMAGQPGYALYNSPDNILNLADLDAVVTAGIVAPGTKFSGLGAALKKARAADPNIVQRVKEAATAMYFDARTFGAVMVGFKDIGASQLRGPVQIDFASSVDPITIQEVTISRCMFTTEAERESKGGTGTMGRKYVVPYGLYRFNGRIGAGLAQQEGKLTGAGFSENDLEILWEAIMNMYEHDYSAGRGHMAVRKLVIFKHDSKHGNAPSHKLFDRVHVQRKPGVDAARSYDDYEVTVDTANMPNGVTCEIRE